MDPDPNCIQLYGSGCVLQVRIHVIKNWVQAGRYVTLWTTVESCAHAFIKDFLAL